MLEIKPAAKAKVLNVIVLSQKNRKPDDNPGAKLAFELQLPAAMLAHLSTKMPSIFFEPAKQPPKQGQLEGVPSATDTPNLTDFGLKVKKLEWEHEMTGYTAVIVLGTGRPETNIRIADSVLSGWKLMPKEGGTVVARFTLESQDVSAETFGRLAKLKSRDIELELHPPVVNQRDIEDEHDAIPPAPARKPGAAEKAAVARVKGPESVPKVPHKGEAKPRTQRGKEATKKALAEGAAAAAGASVSEKGAWPFPKDKPTAGEAPPQSVTVEPVRGKPGPDPTGAFIAAQTTH